MHAGDEVCFEYQERVLAFIDVLGFADLVIASESHLAPREKVGKLLDINDAIGNFLTNLSFANAAFFSDSIVISMARPDQLFYMVREVGYLCRNLLLAGLPCRGAITIGAIYHREGKVVGPALVRAYRIEQEVAIHPRVILDAAAMDYWKAEFEEGSAHPHLESLVKRDRDGQHFLDIFNPEWGVNFIPWTEFDTTLDAIPADAVEFIKAARKQITKGLASYSGNPRVREKYEWLSSECNERAAKLSMTDTSDNLKRLYEIRECAIKSSVPNAYFQKQDDKFTNPVKRPYFVELERELQGLDMEAWTYLKGEICIRLKQRDELRGWQQLMDILNEAKGYNYLRFIGCKDVKFIRRAKGKTPDLRAVQENSEVLCDVKTINISQDEAQRRANGGVGTTNAPLTEGFFSKLISDIETAVSQMQTFNPDPRVLRKVYLVINFDDFMHEYADEYRRQIETFLKALRKPNVEVVLDIKSPCSITRWSSVAIK